MALEQSKEKPAKPPRPTIEDLNAAQDELDAYQAQIEALTRLCETMPDEMGEHMLNAQRPTIERMLKPIQDRISRIQAILEEPEDSPWDGSHHISTLCAQCARQFDGFEHSVPALKVSLKAAGWGRNPDGDHICPGCIAVNIERARLNPTPSPAALAETSHPTETGSQSKGESD